MNIRRGDTVLADLPYNDRTENKKRPALVVQCDRNNERLDDVILAMRTSITLMRVGRIDAILDQCRDTRGTTVGLAGDSAVKCEHLIALHRRFVDRVVGHLPPEVMEEIDRCLKESLGLT